MFFRHNFDTEIGQTQLLEDGTRLVNYVFPEGIGIGWHHEEKKIIHLKTFLPHHMLNKTQQSLVEYIKNHDDSEEFTTQLRKENTENKF